MSKAGDLFLEQQENGEGCDCEGDYGMDMIHEKPKITEKWRIDEAEKNRQKFMKSLRDTNIYLHYNKKETQ